MEVMMKRLMFFSIFLVIPAMLSGCAGGALITIDPAGYINRRILKIHDHAFQVDFVVGKRVIYAYDAYPLRGNVLRFTIETHQPTGWYPCRAYYSVNGGKQHRLKLGRKKASLGKYKIQYAKIGNRRDNAIHQLIVQVYFQRTEIHLDELGQLVRRKIESGPITVVMPVKHYSEFN